MVAWRYANLIPPVRFSRLLVVEGTYIWWIGAREGDKSWVTSR